jgi:hypothetical protein
VEPFTAHNEDFVVFTMDLDISHITGTELFIGCEIHFLYGLTASSNKRDGDASAPLIGVDEAT